MRVDRNAMPSVSLSALRLRGRLPRIAFVSTCVVLCGLGLASVLRGGAPSPHRSRATPPQVDPTAVGFAESFVRTYLTADATDPQERDRRLAAYGLPDEGLPRDQIPATQVIWTAVAGVRAMGSRGAVVTVEADAGRRRWYLAVAVARDAAARLYVTGPPAVVGSPSVARGARSRPEAEVEDRGLRAVASRVVRHYVAGLRDDLAADLAAGAAVSLPSVGLRVADLIAITWVSRPSRIAVVLVAHGQGGMQLTLRYELDVVRFGGRWLVRSMHVNPLYREVSR